ncbi:DUF3618 domain-containing protein [Billgrantia sp. Q4P2]|uniref:DUF3618 domain-containing protein n=1 Tax=Billgrantia sp. Q4P2 TaxID=3463857 RepID=UPI00405652DF
MSQDGRRRTDEIENEVYQARARLDETLHQIEERLSPEQLMNTTYDYLRQGGAERLVSRLGNTIKENPLPVMVTGIGLGWLLLAQRSSHHDHGQYAVQGGYPGATMPRTRMPSGDDMPASGGHETISGAGTTTLGHDPAALGATPRHGDEAHGHGMTRKAHQMAENLRDRAEHLGDQVKERTQNMSEQMRERSSHLWDRQHSAMQSVTHRAQDAGTQATHFVQEHPLVAGALGVAVGAVLGSLFSPTRVENRHLGAMRDRALLRAEEAGQEQLERAEEKIHETAERVKEEARSMHSSHATSPKAPSSNSSGYVENPSSEERFAKAGASEPGSSQPSAGEAVRKGGTSAPSAKPPGSSSSPAKGG